MGYGLSLAANGMSIAVRCGNSSAKFKFKIKL